AARQFLEDLLVADPSPPGMLELLLSILSSQAGDELEASAWDAARALYRDILKIEPGSELATGNIRFSYGEDAAERLAAEGPVAMVQWVEYESAAVPEYAPVVAELAGIIIGNAALDAFDGGRFEEGLMLANARYRWTKNESTRDRLRRGFLLFAQDRLAAGDTGPVLAMLTTLQDEHGNTLGLTEGLANVFGAAAQNALESGDPTTAISTAELLQQTAPSPDSENLLAYIYGAHAEAVAASQGADAALAILADAIGRYPGLNPLRQSAVTIGNNAALAVYDGGDSAGAVAMLEKTLALAGDSETLLQNLLVIYSNWSIDAANAGDMATARQVAEAGLRWFPGDQTLTEVYNFASSP
ncbi:MAG: hypothetical protein ACC631_03660, partial [Halocynthiibacter sp.]